MKRDHHGGRPLLLVATIAFGGTLVLVGAAAWAVLEDGNHLPSWILMHGVVALACSALGYLRPPWWRWLARLLAVPSSGSMALALLLSLSASAVGAETATFAAVLGMLTVSWTIWATIALLFERRHARRVPPQSG